MMNNISRVSTWYRLVLLISTVRLIFTIYTWPYNTIKIIDSGLKR